MQHTAWHAVLCTAAGVLANLPTVLQELLQSSQHQQTVQLTTPVPPSTELAGQPCPSLSRPAVAQMLSCWAALWKLWLPTNPFAPYTNMFPWAVHMLQQVQRCITMLPGSNSVAATTAAHPASAGASSSESRSSRRQDSGGAKQPTGVTAAEDASQRPPACTAAILVGLQADILTSTKASQQHVMPHMKPGVLQVLVPSNLAALDAFLADAAVAEAALQQHAACCILLHTELRDLLQHVSAACDFSSQQQHRQVHKLQQMVSDLPAYSSSVLQQEVHDVKAFLSAVATHNAPLVAALASRSQPAWMV